MHGKMKLDYEKLKKRSKILAKRYQDIGMKDRSEKVYNCADYIRFAHMIKEDKLKREIATVFFCKDKFCPVCMKRKSILMLQKLKDYTEVLEDQGYGFLHLTLTLKNMDDPAEMLRKLWSSWRDLRRRKVFKVFEGAYVSLEVTYTAKNKFHYHLHCLLATKLKLPMEKDKFRELEQKISNEWLDITGDSYIIKLQGAKNVIQFAKYITKMDCIDEMDNKTLREFVKAMKGKKTVSKVGVFRGLDDEIENMMDIEDYKEEEEKVLFYELWRWNNEKEKYDVCYHDKMDNELTEEEVKKTIEELEKNDVKTNW